MNKNQVKGEAKNVAGRIQQSTGDLTGNREQQVKGVVRQVAGKAQSAVGDAQQDLKKSQDSKSH